MTAPAGLALDDQGRPHVLEGGDDGAPPRLLRLADEGAAEIVHVSEPGARWHGLAYGDGGFYTVQTTPLGAAVLHLPADGGPPRLVFEPEDGEATLASPVVGPDGAVYVHLRARGDCLAVLAGKSGSDAGGDCNAIVRVENGGTLALLPIGDLDPVAMAFGPKGALYLALRQAPEADGAALAPLPIVIDGVARAAALPPLRMLAMEGISGLAFPPDQPPTAFIADGASGRVLTMDVASGSVQVLANEFLGMAAPVAVRFAPSDQALYVLDAGGDGRTAGLWRIGL